MKRVKSVEQIVLILFCFNTSPFPHLCLSVIMKNACRPNLITFVGSANDNCTDVCVVVAEQN